MDTAIRRILMFLLGVALGYCTGFSDAQSNEKMVFIRVIDRVQNFAERTVGDPAREREGAAEGVEEQNE